MEEELDASDRKVIEELKNLGLFDTARHYERVCVGSEEGRFIASLHFQTLLSLASLEKRINLLEDAAGTGRVSGRGTLKEMGFDPFNPGLESDSDSLDALTDSD